MRVEMKLPVKNPSGKQQEVEPELGGRPVQQFGHQRGRRARHHHEGAGVESALQHEGVEAQPAETARRSFCSHALAASVAVGDRMGLVHRQIGGERDGAAGQQREAEHAAPAERVGQHAADDRRHHRPERAEHGQIGDRLDQLLGAKGVARDGAHQRQRAAGADRLHQPPQHQRIRGFAPSAETTLPNRNSASPDSSTGRRP